MNKRQLKNKFSEIKTAFWKNSKFVFLVMFFVIANGIATISRWKHFPKKIKTKLQPRFASIYTQVTRALDQRSFGTITGLDLIELSIQNMKSKKTRSIVTIGGMMIGIGAIVYLVSIGYGLQQLVINRVARLDEMRQAEVVPQPSGKLKIDDKTMASFKEIPSVQMVLPLIAVVGRVNYLNSISNVAVYGVTADYLKQSAIKPIKGKIFDSNNLTTELPTDQGQVAGVSTESSIGVFGDKIQDVNLSINPSSWITVREKPSANSQVLGYTKRAEGTQDAEEYWGGSYLSEDSAGKAGLNADGKELGKWLKSTVYLWKKENCDPSTSIDCVDGKYLAMRDSDNNLLQKEAYFAEINVSVSSSNIKSTQVLGVSNTALNWVEIASESGDIVTSQTKTLEMPKDTVRQAVVNQATLSVLGIPENEALGKKFNVSFVIVGDLLTKLSEKVESIPVEYTIIGVIPETKTPIFYVPFIDIRSLGITNYSQIKLIVKNQSDLAKTRKQVEAMGYVTRSVTDTVAQIKSLFATAKTILLLLGMVALSVAALGMFNTLTVSLLERTREVGLMKAMGMKSFEIKQLYLTESVIMGFFGGILGILLGFVLGKLTGLVLSVLTIFKGIGYVDVSYIPLIFIIAIIALSLLIGLITGIYPAKRATKISALNALRYE